MAGLVKRFGSAVRLVAAYDVKGNSAHDARIVASMKVHNVSHVLTFNGPDFTRFPAITVLSP